MKKLATALFLLLLVACSATQNLSKKSDQGLWDLAHLSDEELTMANELLVYGLEHEAIYTLIDTLKPISSLGYSLSYPIAKKAEMNDGDKHVVDITKDSSKTALDELRKWNNVLAALSNERFTFLLIPFKQTRQGKRNLQILVCRRDLLKELILDKAEFFAQWGFTENTHPATLLTTIEYEDRNDRFRAYGYLFGYPEYAVDFFVQASISEEVTGDFVKRDFFHMPVAVGTSGYFTYAIPKGSQPTAIDSSIYNRASATLKKYRSAKESYLNADGQLNAISYLSDVYKSLRVNQ